jgi:hypothetical protein
LAFKQLDAEATRPCRRHASNVGIPPALLNEDLENVGKSQKWKKWNKRNNYSISFSERIPEMK